MEAYVDIKKEFDFLENNTENLEIPICIDEESVTVPVPITESASETITNDDDDDE